MLLFHLKIYKNNYYVIVSNTTGKLLFTLNSGQVGFTHINKNSIEALKQIVKMSFNKLIHLNLNKLFFKIEVPNKYTLYILYKEFILLLNKYKINMLILTLVNKISHGGCRNKLS
jgi:ribosomal protein S11